MTTEQWNVIHHSKWDDNEQYNCVATYDNYKRALKGLLQNCHYGNYSDYFILDQDGKEYHFSSREEILIAKGVLHKPEPYNIEKHIMKAKWYVKYLRERKIPHCTSYLVFGAHPIYRRVRPEIKDLVIKDLTVSFSASIWDVDDQYNWDEKWRFRNIAPYDIEWCISATPYINGKMCKHEDAIQYLKKEGILEGEEVNKKD